MFNFDECKSTVVKTKVREIAFQDLLDSFIDRYGVENVSIVGNNEIAVCIGTRTLTDGTIGEVVFTVKPVAKDFDSRVTESGKPRSAYERLSESDAYELEKTEKEKKAEEKARLKAEKIKRDKKARESKKE